MKRVQVEKILTDLRERRLDELMSRPDLITRLDQLYQALEQGAVAKAPTQMNFDLSPKQSLEARSSKVDLIQLYSDGACRGNPGPGAWGYVQVRAGLIVRENSGVQEMTTNNQMELMAAIKALEDLLASDKESVKFPVELHSDSK